MQTFTVGQKVRVISLETLQSIGDKMPVDGGYFIDKFGFYFTRGMTEHCGKVVTIAQNVASNIYRIIEDKKMYSWKAFCFEPLSELDMLVNDIENELNTPDKEPNTIYTFDTSVEDMSVYCC